jgi:uncharacterized protein
MEKTVIGGFNMNTITTAARPSLRAHRACAMFGLRIEHTPMRAITSLRPFANAARTIDRTLEPSSIAFVTGPSGSGKSTILRALHHRLAKREARSTHNIIIADPARLTMSNKPIVDLFASPLTSTLKQLARVGLADAMLFARTPAELSDGQRLRLSIALAMAHAQRTKPPTTILADEFASVLDRPTARALAMGVRRWIRDMPDIRFVAAAARDDVLEALDPDLLVYQPLLGSPRFHRRKEPS